MSKPALFDDGPFAPCPARFNMAAHTFAPAQDAPGRLALEVLGRPGKVLEHWSHGEMRDAVLRTAGGLAAHGLKQGDRVLLRVGNCSDFPILYFAAIAIGAVPVPTSALLTESEIAAILDDLEPALICLGDGLGLPETRIPTVAGTEIAALRMSAPAAFADTAADDPAFMVYTSGTGGRPKGVVHAHRAAWARRMMWRDWYGLEPDDRVLHAGAFNWTYTLGAALTDPWARGAAALIYTGTPDRHVWPDLAAAHRATIFAAVPGVYRQMLGDDAALAEGFRHLRHGLSAGEALPQKVAEAWTRATGKPIYEALGMSEVSTYISFCSNRPPRAGRAGYPQPGRRVAILAESDPTPVGRGEDGLLAVSNRDPGLMLGYWRRADETKAAFRGEWFLTGDRARMEEDGALVYLGRADDVMNAGGYRVSPAEVEHALLHHPGVAEAAVVEQPIREGVSIITAYYVPRGGEIAETELSAHCAETLARYKCPRAFRAVDTLPRGANGKILRRKLRQMETEWPPVSKSSPT
ncbi:MAG: AMP-binding protein [Pseudomonadota bacterium]